jgi:hypothetical protein
VNANMVSSIQALGATHNVLVEDDQEITINGA